MRVMLLGLSLIKFVLVVLLLLLIVVPLIIDAFPLFYYYSPTSTSWSVRRRIMNDKTAVAVKVASTFDPEEAPQQKQKRQFKRIINKLLLLLDRDGVINEDVGSPGVTEMSQLKLTPNAGNAIARLRVRYQEEQIIGVVVITNQSCVGKGLITNRQLDIIQQHVQKLLLEENSNAIIDRIYQCTSTKEMNDLRMKPSPGMILEAMDDYLIIMKDQQSKEQPHPKEPQQHKYFTTCFVGDTITDLEAAAAANVTIRILVSTGYGKSLMTNIRHDGKQQTLPNDIFSSPHNDGNDVIHCTNPDDVIAVAGINKFPQSVFPFVYCRNLDHAVDYILDFISEKNK